MSTACLFLEVGEVTLIKDALFAYEGEESTLLTHLRNRFDLVYRNRVLGEPVPTPKPTTPPPSPAKAKRGRKKTGEDSD